VLVAASHAAAVWSMLAVTVRTAVRTMPVCPSRVLNRAPLIASQTRTGLSWLASRYAVRPG
jgi:hypothetical protein